MRVENENMRRVDGKIWRNVIENDETVGGEAHIYLYI